MSLSLVDLLWSLWCAHSQIGSYCVCTVSVLNDAEEMDEIGLDDLCCAVLLLLWHRHPHWYRAVLIFCVVHAWPPSWTCRQAQWSQGRMSSHHASSPCCCVDSYRHATPCFISPPISHIDYTHSVLCYLIRLTTNDYQYHTRCLRGDIISCWVCSVPFRIPLQN